MNLLVDFLTARYRHGSGEYFRRVFLTILERIREEHISDISLFALYDSAIPIAFEDMQPDSIKELCDITFLDIQKKSIADHIKDNNIDKFFVACSQRLAETQGFSDVSCPIVSVTHDLAFEEFYFNRLYEYFSLPKLVYKDGVRATRLWNVYSSFRLFLSEFKMWLLRRPLVLNQSNLTLMRTTIDLLKSNPLSVNVVVSNYTKASMLYHFNIPEDSIKVLYSPERIQVVSSGISNPELSRIVTSGHKYYLMLSCDRSAKNAEKAIAAFHKFTRHNKDIYLLTTAYRGIVKGNHIDLGFLSDGDLDQALKNCYALIYPSFFEGFGYPPLEAMKYGKPVLSSNTTSLPEVLGDAPVYFSPLYESAIFEALHKLNGDNYIVYSQKSRSRYLHVREKQESDLKELVSIILFKTR